jgi:glycosyltransferase involved in cell wall biosynthesis
LINLPTYLGVLAWLVCLLQGKRFALRLAGDWAEMLELGFIRVGHPWIGHVVAGLHRLLVLAMTRTAGIAFANGYGLWRRYGAGNPRVIHIVSSTYSATDVAEDAAPGQPVTPRLLYVGAMNFSKGLVELLQAAKRLDEEGVIFDLHLAGSGGRKGFFQEMALKMGIAKRVQFLDWIDHGNIARLYRSTDVFVLPSYSEGCPKVILEAMAAGVPIVGTSVGGIPYVVRNGREGFVVAPRDVEGLFEALHKLLADKELRKRMGKAALARARLFTIENERATVAAGFRKFGFLGPDAKP